MELVSLRVLLVDDNETFRRLVRIVLECSEMRIVGDEPNGIQAIAATTQLRPDVILMDYQMPLMDGLTATRLIKQLPYAPRIILFTSDDSPNLAEAAAQAGADAVLSKGCALELIGQTIGRVVGHSASCTRHAA